MDQSTSGSRPALSLLGFWHLQSAHRTSLRLKNSASGASQQCSAFHCSYKDAALVRSALCARVMWHLKRRTQSLKQNKFILHATSEQLQVEPADPEPAAGVMSTHWTAFQWTCARMLHVPMTTTGQRCTSQTAHKADVRATMLMASSNTALVDSYPWYDWHVGTKVRVEHTAVSAYNTTVKNQNTVISSCKDSKAESTLRFQTFIVWAAAEKAGNAPCSASAW